MRWLSLVLSLAWLGPAAAADWPQVLGPNRNGTTSETIAAWKTPPRCRRH